MSVIKVDGREIEIADDQNLLAGLLQAGVDLPYFCWHPTMGSVGACRLCAVKQYNDDADTRGRVIMSCMTPAKGVARLSVTDPEAAELRKGVIEWVMTNHPHDCPVCDAGGQCHLQDMTVLNGHSVRRHRYAKRTFKNQKLGPVIHHEMNRCITCYRCVRYYKDYAGGQDFDAYASKNHVYFGRPEDGTLESAFAGNLVEVCPTGVFTDKTARQHYARKWDLQMAPSVCAHCSVGCNLIPGERYGTLRQVQNRYHDEINGHFLCDRGRFGYEHARSDARLRKARGPLGDMSVEAAVASLTSALRDAKGVVGIGSPRASLESNHALRLAVGGRFYAGVAAAEDALTRRALELLRGPARVATVQDVEKADAAFVLGEDLHETAPRLALALRQVSMNQPRAKAQKLGIPAWHDAALRTATQNMPKGSLFLATPGTTRLDRDAAGTLHAGPAHLARVGFAVARAIDPSLPPVDGLEPGQEAWATRVADALRAAERPVILSGVHPGEPALLEAAAAIARALVGAGKAASISLAVAEANSLGLAMLGGGTLDEALGALERGEADTVIVLENDLFRRADAARVRAALGRARVIALDSLETPTTALAALALPTSVFAEETGTFVNQEGRAQRYFEVYLPLGDNAPSWAWLGRAGRARGTWAAAPEHEHDAILDDLAEATPALAPIAHVGPDSDWRAWGLKLPRQPHRYSGRTAMNAAKSVHEPKPAADTETPYAFSMEGVQGRALQTMGANAPFFWAPSWNSNQANLRFQSKLGGPLRGDKAGVRLLEPSDEAAPLRFALPAAPTGAVALPGHRVFGSEELSNRAPAIVALAGEARVRVSGLDAAAFGVAPGGRARVTVGGHTLDLPVTVDDRLAKGCVLLPVGEAGVPFLALPAPVTVEGIGAATSARPGVEVSP